MKRLIALLLLLLLPVAAFAEELTPEEAYTEYVELLDTSINLPEGAITSSSNIINL